jgi:hypothetical protein
MSLVMPGEVRSLLVPHLSTEKDDSDTMRKKKVLSCVYHAMLGVELFLAPLWLYLCIPVLACEH